MWGDQFVPTQGQTNTTKAPQNKKGYITLRCAFVEGAREGPFSAFMCPFYGFPFPSSLFFFSFDFPSATAPSPIPALRELILSTRYITLVVASVLLTSFSYFLFFLYVLPPFPGPPRLIKPVTS